MPFALGVWALLLGLVVRAGGDAAAAVGAAAFVAGSIAASLLSSDSRARVRSAGAVVLVAPWFALGAYGWMDLPLGASCYTCSAHFCGFDYSRGDGSVELGWTLWLPIVLVGLLAAASARVGERALRSMAAHLRWLLLGSASWAVLSLGLLSAHSARTVTRAQYIATLPLVATVVPESAEQAVSSDSGVAGIAIEARTYPGDRYTGLSLRRGDAHGSCGLEGASGRIDVRQDNALHALFFVPERGVAVACHESDLQCRPVSALELIHRFRPSPAWFIWAVVGLASAAGLQAWRAARARTLLPAPQPAPVGVYREPEREEDDARARTVDTLLALDGWTVAVLLMSSAPLVTMLLVHLGWWPP